MPLPVWCTSLRYPLVPTGGQAQEWGDYKFWSCADISVVPTYETPLAECFGHGSLQKILLPTPKGADSPHQCGCNPGYSGDFCQNADECVTDHDCNGNGKCLEVDSLNSPRRVCYCHASFFGRKCEKKFVPTEKDLTDKCFNYAGLNGTGEKYDVDSLFNSSCYRKTLIKGDNLLYWRVVEKSVEVIMRFTTASWLGLGWHPLGLNSTCQDFPVRDNGDVGQSRSGREAAKPEPSGKASDPQPSASNLHPMDCSDMVIGSARGQLSRVGDFYTRDRSTPLDDEVYRGTNSLTAAFGREVGRATVIMFRKPLEAAERADHSMTGKLQVIWAKGQTQGDYSHAAKSGLDEGRATLRNFYTDKILKYHGSDNRGLIVMSFTGAGRSAREGEVDGQNLPGGAPKSSAFGHFWLVSAGFLYSAVLISAC